MKIGIMFAALVAAATAVDVHAQAGAAYPQKPIRVIVPYAAGGGTDIIARAVAVQMSAARNRLLTAIRCS
jgi:tripartite-type tricarboxylate transporter receptor subunit TctC